MNGRCKNCKYFHKLKIDQRIVVTLPRNSNVISGLGVGHRRNSFDSTSCCIAFTRLCDPCDDVDDYDSFVIETTENDTCEMFTERCNFEVDNGGKIKNEGK